MSSDCCGSRLAAVNSPSRTRLNFQLNRAMTNATIEARNSVRITAGTVTYTELRKCWAKFACSQALM